MIDLGDELNDYTEQAAPTTVPNQPAIRSPSDGYRVPLADLQAQGFNHTPPAGYVTDEKLAELFPDGVAPWMKRIVRGIAFGSRPSLPNEK